MAKFKVSRRECNFLPYKNRVPEHGANGKTVIDLPIRYKGTKRDADSLLLTVSGEKASDLLWHDGVVEMPYLSPLSIGRTLEGLLVMIWDEATKSKTPLRFANVTAKDIVAELNAKHIIEVTMKLVIEPDPEKELPRLARLQTLDSARDIEIEGQQGDIFGEEAEEPEEGEQADMVGDAAEETAEEEDE